VSNTQRIGGSPSGGSPFFNFKIVLDPNGRHLTMVDAVKVVVTTSTASLVMSGVKAISVRHSFNAPSVATVSLSNVVGARQDIVKRGDSLRITAYPEVRATTTGDSYFSFFGRITEVDANSMDFSITATDHLGLLSNEILTTNPTSIATKTDAASIIKQIIAESNYDIDIDQIIGETRIEMSDGLDLTGKTRLSAIQYIMGQVNVTPIKYRIYGKQTSQNIAMERLASVDDTSYIPYIAGRIPRTSAPLDFYPTMIDRVEDDSDLVNLVTVRNQSKGILVSEPSTVPANPIQRLYDESSVTDETQASLFARQILNQQGISKMRWIVEGLPGRFDFKVGDIMEFASIEGGLAGRQMIFDISWRITPSGSTMKLEVGRQTPDLVTAIRFASSLST
jgi:hypothetical protein